MNDQGFPRRAAVVGAGLIGRSWAVVFASAGLEVRICDTDAGRLEEAMRWFDGALPDLAEAALIDEPSEIRARIFPASTLADAVDGADWVQECTLEVAETKAGVFAELDRLAPPTAILASSTSSFAPSAFASDCAGRNRCLVAHPVNPPHLIPLVEILPGPWTDTDVVTRAEAFMERLGQAPIVVRKEIRGFVLNRLQGALLDEAFRLVEGGYASAEDVDRCLVDGLALRWSFMGPFETIDLNAAGGVADYAAKYRAMYYGMSQDRGPAREWDDAAVAKVTEERRAVLPDAAIPERQAWRDRRLMRLAAERRRTREGTAS